MRLKRFERGPSYVVVGRPIIAAPDPRAAAVDIATQITPGMTELLLLTRDGCHLCDEMKAVIADAATHAWDWC